MKGTRCRKIIENNLRGNYWTCIPSPLRHFWASFLSALCASAGYPITDMQYFLFMNVLYNCVCVDYANFLLKNEMVSVIKLVHCCMHNLNNLFLWTIILFYSYFILLMLYSARCAALKYSAVKKSNFFSFFQEKLFIFSNFFSNFSQKNCF